MKARISKEEIDYIKCRVEKYGNISIYVGELSLSVLERLRNHFKVTKEYFGYYRFEKLNN